jgi:uncharacterized protein
MISRSSIAVMIGMVVVAADWLIIGLLPWPKAMLDIPYLKNTVVNLFDVGAMVVLLRLIGGVGVKSIWQTLGFDRAFRASAVWAAMLFLPPALIMGFALPLDISATATDHLFKGLAYPMLEEIAFRGLATGILLLICGWRFLPAALIPAAFFGAAHAVQGTDLTEALSLAAITGLGGLLFGWLYTKWDNSLWPPFFLHSGLNLLWGVFDLGDNAIGGWFGNALRIAVVAAAIILTLFGRGWLNRMAGSEPAT